MSAVMDANDYKRVSEVFLEVCNLDPSAWSSVLDARCGEDTHLRLEVESMLKHDSAIGLESPLPRVVEVASKSVALGKFGHFELHGLLGEGGMGAVYRATDSSLNRIVALKIMSGGSQNESRFQIEAQAVAKLDHAGIVPIYEFGEYERRLYIAMRFIDGKDLAAFVQKSPVTPERAATMMREIAQAVAYVHQCGLIHRDIKPSNILVHQSGHIQLTDFGLARHLDTASELTVKGQVLGTASYMSPEQASGKHAQVGPATDIYAVGAVLYYLLTGRPPFLSETVLDTMRKVTSTDATPPRRLNERCPRNLETICLKCLEKDIGRRYASAQELSDDLGRYLRNEPIRARRVGFVESSWLWCKRNPRAIAVNMVAIVLLLLGGLVVRETRSHMVASGLLNRLLEAPTREVPDIVEAMKPWHSRLHKPLTDELATVESSTQRLHVRLALLPHEPSQSTALYGDLLEADAEQAEVIRRALMPWKDELVEKLWRIVQAPSGPEWNQLLPATSALAAYAPADPRWDEVAGNIANAVVESSPLDMRWIHLMHPVRQSLVDPLSEIAHDQATTDERRTNALMALTVIIGDAPDRLAELVMTIDPNHFHVLLPALKKDQPRLASLLRRELKRELPRTWPVPSEVWPDPPRDYVIKQIESAFGIVTEHFAVCQTLPLADFEETCYQLGETGYRPIRFRPYVVDGTVVVAGMWTRDNIEWRLKFGLSPDEYHAFNTTMRNTGFIPLDIAGYFPERDTTLIQCAGLWMRAGHLRTLEVKIGPLTKELEDTLKKEVELQLKTQTLHFVTGPDGRRWTSRIYHNRLLGRAEGDTEIAATDRFADLPVDIPLRDVRFGPEIELAGLWSSDYAYESNPSQAREPPDPVDRLKGLAAKGYRPAGVAVCTDATQPWQLAAWQWRLPAIPEVDQDVLASRQANAAIALVHLGELDHLRETLRHRPTPQLRTYLIHRMVPSGVDPVTILETLRNESDPSVRRALLLSLGKHAHDRRTKIDVRQVLRDWRTVLCDLRRHNGDAGTESAFEWLFQSWGIEQEFDVSSDLAPSDKVPRNWTISSQGHKLVQFEGPTDVLVGTPISENGLRVASEYERIARIPWSFEISTTEVTIDQFERISIEPRERQLGATNRYAQSVNCPVNEIACLDGMKYSRWLSEMEQIPEEEMCYPPIEQIHDGYVFPESHLTKTGYRLPTFEEWEHACRAGSRTSRYYGYDPQLLPEYAWFNVNSNDQTWPVGMLKPNDFGLFDMLGNVGEWCHATHCLRAFRGEHFMSASAWTRAACYATVAPGLRYRTMGFRLARTIRRKEAVKPVADANAWDDPQANPVKPPSVPGISSSEAELSSK